MGIMTLPEIQWDTASLPNMKKKEEWSAYWNCMLCRVSELHIPIRLVFCKAGQCLVKKHHFGGDME